MYEAQGAIQHQINEAIVVDTCNPSTQGGGSRCIKNSKARRCYTECSKPAWDTRHSVFFKKINLQRKDVSTQQYSSCRTWAWFPASIPVAPVLSGSIMSYLWRLLLIPTFMPAHEYTYTRNYEYFKRIKIRLHTVTHVEFVLNLECAGKTLNLEFWKAEEMLWHWITPQAPFPVCEKVCVRLPRLVLNNNSLGSASLRLGSPLYATLPGSETSWHVHLPYQVDSCITL